MKFKSVIVLMLAMPVLAFGQSCYQATSKVPTSIPVIFCLESITETEILNVLSVTSPNASFPSELKIISSSRHNEDRLNFTAQAILADEWDSGCGEGFSAFLNVKGQIAYGNIDANELVLAVDIHTTHDTCHSTTFLETISYKKL